MCKNADIPLVERPLSLHNVAVAEEAFFTSTSLCICPLRSFNGQKFNAVPGPVTKRLMDAFSARVGYDYVSQYLKHLSDAQAGTGF